MGLVIAFIVITAVYVGYFASQSQPEVETHGISYNPAIQSMQNPHAQVELDSLLVLKN